MSALALSAGVAVAAYVWAAQRVPWSLSRTLCFIGGCSLAVAAPGFGDGDLARHMVEHGVIVSIAAPLIAVAAPFSLLARILEPERRARLARALRSTLARGVIAGSPLLFIVAIWTVHVPSVIEWIDRNPFLHALEHAGLASIAVLFWSFCLGGAPGPRPSALTRAAILLAAAPACDFAAIGLMVAGQPGAGAAMLASSLPIAIVGAWRLWLAATAEDRIARALEGRAPRAV